MEASGAHVWVDTSGAALRAAVAGGPLMIKVNQYEAGEMAGFAIDLPTDAVSAAERFRDRALDPLLSLWKAKGLF